ncbi:MAG TPA: hypothetical protein VNO18_09050, partial [Xanthobacteraceae bacterium]|nr:hypothetical protein [Xanthobacteraceae bacterium]
RNTAAAFAAAFFLGGILVRLQRSLLRNINVTTRDRVLNGSCRRFWRKSLIENRNGLQTRYLYPSKCHF